MQTCEFRPFLMYCEKSSSFYIKLHYSLTLFVNWNVDDIIQRDHTHSVGSV